MTEKLLPNEIWHNLLRTTQLKHYSNRLGRRMKRLDIIIRIITLAFAVAGGGYLAIGNPEENPVEFTTIVIVLSVFVIGFVLRAQEKATVLHFVGLECGRIRDAYHDLWSQLHDEVSEEPQIRKENRALVDRLTEIAGWAGFVDLFEDSCLNKECRKTAKDELRERYSSRNGSVT